MICSCLLLIKYSYWYTCWLKHNPFMEQQHLNEIVKGLQQYHNEKIEGSLITSLIIWDLINVPRVRHNFIFTYVGPCEGEDTYRCANGRCIRRANLCDAYCDCVPVAQNEFNSSAKIVCEDERNCDKFYSMENGEQAYITYESSIAAFNVFCPSSMR